MWGSRWVPFPEVPRGSHAMATDIDHRIERERGRHMGGVRFKKIM